MKQRLNILACLCVLLTVLTLLVLKAGTVKATTFKAATLQDCGAWSITPSANVKNAPYGDILYATSAISQSDVWSVGFYSSPTGSFQTLTEHWDGSKWSIVASPQGGNFQNLLNGVTAISSDDVWAVGSYTDSKGNSLTLAEHWNGSQWSIVKTPNPKDSFYNALQNVTAVASNDVWAVGYYNLHSGGNTALVEHWNGTTWSISTSPRIGGILNSVSASATNNVWAVGESYGSNGKSITLTEHWNGSQWSVVTSLNIGKNNNALNSVTTIAPNDVWAVGFYTNHLTDQTLIEHWNGTNWSIVASPNVGLFDNALLGVASVSASTNIWAVGNYTTNTTNHSQALTEQWNGSSWNVVATPKPHSGGSNYLNSVSVIPGTNMLWVAGFLSLPGQDGLNQTLTEYYC